MAAIASYIIIYMFVIKKGYLELEQAKGAAVTHVFGDAVAVSNGRPGSRYFSTEELTFPGLENGNVFVATRQTTWRQKRGVCEEPSLPCVTAAQCTSWANATCSPNGFCVEPSWCDDGGHPEPEIYHMDTQSLQIWVRSTIQFLKLAAGKVFSTEAKDPTPSHGVNTFTVRELLMKCEPLPVRFEEVAELGAIIEVQFFWECDVASKHGCLPSIRARRLDSIFDPDNIGFGYSYSEYVNGHTRVINQMRGIRLFFRTSGIGRKVSVSTIINKASLGAALFTLAHVVADLLMTKVFKLREKYKARKFLRTPDFSDYLEKVDQRQETKFKPEAIDAKEREVVQMEAEWMQSLDDDVC